MRIRGRQATRLIGAAAREPLVQFLFIGSVIFLAAELLRGTGDAGDRMIRVDTGVTHHLTTLYRQQFGTEPDAATFDALIAAYVRDEVLYREALRLGIGDNDEIVRRRLVQKMEFLLQDEGNVAESGDEELRAYFAAHAADFTAAGTVSFTHRYFAGGEDDRRRAETALAVLIADTPQAAAITGDLFPLQNDYTDFGRRAAEQTFGHGAFIDALFTAPIDTWSGPYRSGYGWHLIRVQGRVDDVVAEFADVRDAVREACLRAKRQRQYQEQIAKLTATYTVVREPRNDR